MRSWRSLAQGVEIETEVIMRKVPTGYMYLECKQVEDVKKRGIVQGLPYFVIQNLL